MPEPNLSGPAHGGLSGFEARLDSLRIDLQIPGIGAAIVQNEQIVWSRGFGFADLADQRLATPTTSFHLASLTKTFAAIIIMQLVEEGLLDLDTPISQYGVDLPNADAIHVRHLMTHTSEGSPGAAFKYNGDRFGELGKVIEAVSEQSFGELLVERIVHPLGLPNTAPNVRHDRSFKLTGFDRDAFIANMATGYEVTEGECRRKIIHPSYAPSMFLLERRASCKLKRGWSPTHVEHEDRESVEAKPAFLNSTRAVHCLSASSASSNPKPICCALVPVPNTSAHGGSSRSLRQTSRTVASRSAVAASHSCRVTIEPTAE